MEILLNHVSYTYDSGMAYEKPALIGVDLNIHQGEFIGIIGRTGSGKSTLVRMLNGLLRPDYGGVYVDGEDIHDRDYDLAKLRGRVGMVFQYPEHQLFESTVIKDVKFGPSNQGLDELACEIRSYEALKQVGIGEELIDASPMTLSGGQKRRVAIAGVLAMQPEVLILDEPTAGLDPKGRDDMYSLLHSLNDGKDITIIIITHSMEDVAEHVKRVIAMRNGRIVMDGTPQDVFSSDEIFNTGLCPPVSAKLIRALVDRGLPVDKGAVTGEQAVREIIRVVKIG